jgi:exopolysaccharide production protein ExoQ
MPTWRALPDENTDAVLPGIDGITPVPAVDDEPPRLARRAFDGFALLRALVLFAVLEKALGPRWGLPQSVTEIYEQSRIVRYLEFGTACMALGIGTLHIRRISARLVRQPDLVLFLLFALMTGALQPGDKISAMSVAFSYAEAYLAFAAIVLYDGAETVTRRLFQFFVFVVLVNIAAFTVPSVSFMQRGELHGAYRGLYSQRNDLSYVASLALVYILVECRHPFWRLFLAGLATLLLIVAGSIQGIILSMVGASIIMALRGTGRFSSYRGLLLAGLIPFIIAFYLLIPDLLDNFLGLFNRDSSFDNRDRIWALAYYMIARMPTLGYGIQQFRSDVLPVGVMSSFRLGTTFGSAHSSYLEAVLDFGWIGATLFFLILLRQVANLLLVIFGRKEVRNPAAVALTLYCLIGGLTASEKMFLPGAGWMSFVIAKMLLESERSNV